MTKKTCSVEELAARLGVLPKDVRSAKYSKCKTVVPGTMRARVLIGMRDLGLTWDQIVNDPVRSSQRIGVGAVPISELLAATPAPAAVEEQEGGNASFGKNETIPVSELLANSEKTPKLESFIPSPDTLRPLPLEPVNAVESEQIQHCYHISLRGRDASGSFVWKSVTMGIFEGNKVTKRDIVEAIELSGLHNAVPITVSYLGEMTKEEFENV